MPFEASDKLNFYAVTYFIHGHPAAIAYLERFGQRAGCRFLLARAKVSACCQTKTIPEALAAQP